MNPEKWNKVKEIFTLVADLPESEREKALEQASGGDGDEIRNEVKKLLVSDEKARTLYDGLSIISKEREYEAPDTDKIGNYIFLRKIGVGGMGAVYLARRADLPQQKVALKIIRHGGGGDSEIVLRRFRREQEILSKLEHPNIARLLDIGVERSGDLPFLVMEFVEGTDLIDYCRLNNLSIEEKLKLFRKVCEAVSYAHSRLVVHRDLKPSNILVNEAREPKLLDFGISKMLSETDGAQEKGTITAVGILTPNYASPEQFRGETVTTATDVYSLGVILYELLTGALPYDVTNRRIDEVARIVCETAPRRPSDSFTHSHLAESTKAHAKNQTSKFLRGDLDNILLKSLRKEPERRYSSIERLSEDLRRHLEGLPVTARPDIFSYRAEKFVKRNLGSVVAGLLIFLTLLGGIAATSVQTIRAERERQLADERFNQVRRLANDVLFKYNDALAKLEGSTEIRASLVKDATGYLDALTGEQENSDLLQRELAEAYLRIGDVQGETYRANLGDTEGAFSNYGKALGICENLERAETDVTETANLKSRVLLQLGKLQIRRGKFDEATDFLRQAAIIRERLAQIEPNQIEHKRTLAKIFISLGDAALRNEKVTPHIQIENGIAYFEKALTTSDALLAAPDAGNRDLQTAAAAHQRLGNIFSMKSRAPDADLFDQSLNHFKKATEIYGELAGREPRNVEYQRNFADQLLMQAYTKSRSERSIKSVLSDCRAATATLESIAASDRNNKEAQFDAAMAYYQTSNVIEGSRTKISDGINLMLRAVEILERLNAENQNLDEFRVNLKYAYSRLSGMYKASGNTIKSAFYQKKAQAF